MHFDIEPIINELPGTFEVFKKKAQKEVACYFDS